MVDDFTRHFTYFGNVTFSCIYISKWDEKKSLSFQFACLCVWLFSNSVRILPTSVDNVDRGVEFEHKDFHNMVTST